MKGFIQIDELRGNMLPLRNWDIPLRMYYDETNNIRRLTLSEVGLNAPDNRTFVIGGVAIPPEYTISGWEALRESLGIQRTANEVKYKHIAQIDYEEALSSRKLCKFLTWLLDSNFLIHYSALDVVYWSIIDIIESLMPGDPLGINAYHLALKAELYDVVIRDHSAFMALLHKFLYPNVERANVSLFLKEVANFISLHAPADRNHISLLLKDTLLRGSAMDGLELPFLHDNEPGELINDFSIHFLHCVCTFKNASHIFDREKYVERVLDRVELRDGERRLDYKFADSKSEIGIQLSDIVTGFIGRHFSYLQSKSLPLLRERKANFSEMQLKNLHLIRDIISRSDIYSNGLFHAILPLDTIFKNDAFLHNQEVPSFLG